MKVSLFGARWIFFTGCATFHDSTNNLKQNSVILQEKEAVLKFSQVTIAPVYTFMEYISGGTQIHCCFAIDFTASK